MVTMRPTWLIEADAFLKESERIQVEIRRQGMLVDVVHHETFASGYLKEIAGKKLREDDCVLFLGTWPLWRHIQLHWGSWTPGGWCNTENLDCSRYYPHFEQFLLNRDHTVMTGSVAIENRAELFEQYGKDDQVFVRPTGCL